MTLRHHRRTFMAALPALAAARSWLGAAGAGATRIGLCSFSCHRHWQAARDHSAEVKFHDTPGFYDYARSLGADGVQASVAALDENAAGQLRDHVEKTGGGYEGDVKLPAPEGDFTAFEREVRLCRVAGATVARTVLSGTRRYETWKTLAEFREFRARAARRLELAEPVAKRHGLKLAIENHKDLTADELAALLRECGSEWIGVNVDTGNNLALLDDPEGAIDLLAPFALAVHFKDMALQPDARGFLLSEVPCGSGMLDLERIVRVLRRSNPALMFNLEMATRDPLVIPCLTDGYWATFPDRKATRLDAALRLVQQHPPPPNVPRITGKPMPQQLADEEANNRASLAWMRSHLGN